MTEKRPVRIGNGSGFWGDTPAGPLQLVRAGGLDYLTLDYLAEVTLSIMTRFRRRDPAAGYATDFIEVLERIAPLWKGQPGLRIVTNAGGVNPEACTAAAVEVMRRAGLGGKRIAVVRGDDLMPGLDGWLAAGERFANLETGEPLQSIRPRVVTANAYVGYAPVAEALAKGADLVLAGRVADPALTLGPAVFHHGWKAGQWDALAGAAVAGHLIECGCQVTGGISTNWLRVPDIANIGFPIVEIAADGSCVVTKPAGTGGAVTTGIVKEQLVYEIQDPREFLTPDVIVDFTTLRVAAEGPDRVRVAGATGRPPTDFYKVSIAYEDGYMASGELTIFGEDAAEKAKRAGDAVVERLRREGVVFESHHVEALRGAASLPGMIATVSGQGEAGLRVTVRDHDRARVHRFTRELASLITAGPPGTTGYAGGRPRVREVMAYWPALVRKSLVTTSVEIIEVGA